MPTFVENQQTMESLDPENNFKWRQLTSKQHRALNKKVRDAQQSRAQQLAVEAQQAQIPATPAIADTESDEDFADAKSQQTPGTKVSPGLQHAANEMSTELQRKGAFTVAGAVGNVIQSAEKVKQSPRSPPPDPENFHAHVDDVVRNELQNIALSQQDDEDALGAVYKAAETIQNAPQPGSEALQGTTVLNEHNADIATPGRDLAKLQEVVGNVREQLGKLPPQQLQFSSSESIDIPRTKSEADEQTESPGRSPTLGERESSIRMQHPHVATALQTFSNTQKMDTQKLVSAIRADSGKFSSTKTAAKALDNLENAPLTAKLFERGLLSAENVINPQYVAAMEKSLQLRQERTGTIQQSNARRSSQPQYTRTVARPDGAYQYKRPHFDTSPMFGQQDGEGLKDTAQLLYALGKTTIGSKKSKRKARNQIVSGAKSAIGL